MENARIISLYVENVKKVKAVHIKPDTGEPIIEITGRNGHGKTSVLDAIMYALAGGKVLPPRPVRDGADRAEIVVELNDLIVERTFTKAGGTNLVVKSKDGARYPSPQSILDKLFGDLAFDPLAFSRLDAKKQVQTLQEIAGLDFTDIDRRRKTAFDERTATNRDLKAAQALFDATQPVDAPDQEYILADLLEEHKAATEQLNKNANTRSALIAARDCEEACRAKIDKARAELANLESQLPEFVRIRENAERQVENLTVPDLEGIQERIKNAEDTNRKVRLKRSRTEKAARVTELTRRSEDLSAAIKAADEERDHALANASFPIEGLSFSDDGVLFNGIPFEQCSSAEQLRISVAIAVALKGTVSVMLVRDGSLLDSESRSLLAAEAERHNLQVWLERATDGEPVGVVIEDGAVISPGVAVPA